MDEELLRQIEGETRAAMERGETYPSSGSLDCETVLALVAAARQSAERRERFAMAAMTSLLTNRGVVGPKEMRVTAKQAFEMADAMLDAMKGE